MKRGFADELLSSKQVISRRPPSVRPSEAFLEVIKATTLA